MPIRQRVALITTVPTVPSTAPTTTSGKTRRQLRQEAANQRATIAASRRQQVADNRAAIVAARQRRRLELLNAPVGVTQQTNPSTSFNTDEFVRGVLGKALDVFGGDGIGSPAVQKGPSTDEGGNRTGLFLLLGGGALLVWYFFFK